MYFPLTFILFVHAAMLNCPFHMNKGTSNYTKEHNPDSAKPRPMTNDICQSLRLDLVNINVNATFYQNIMHCSKVRTSFIFVDFWPRQSLDQWEMRFGTILGKSLSLSMRMQTFIKIFQTVQEIGPVSLFPNLDLGKAWTNDKWNPAIPWARSCQYQCIGKILSKHS